MPSFITTICSSLTWVFVDKFLRLILILISEVILARYLGPEHFGIYSYVLTICSLFLVFASFGIDNILVKDLVHLPGQSNVLITSGVMIKFLGGTCAFFISTIWAYFFSYEFFSFVALVAFAHLFHWTKVFELFYQSQSKFRVIALSASLTGVCFFVIKLMCIVQSQSISSFFFIYFFELIVTGLVILIIYSWNQKLSIEIDWDVIKRHINMSWPLVLSGVAVSIYMKIDQIILQQLAGSAALGIYAAAIKLSEGWYFFGGLVTTALAPHIYRLQKQKSLEYDIFLKKILAYLFLLALLIVVFTLLTSEILLNFLYGSSYQGASSILNVHIWSVFFAYLGCVQGIYWVAEGLQKIFLYQNLFSAVLNILLNLLLIPSFEAVGAAWATLMAYGLPAILVPYIMPRGRHLHNIHLGALCMAASILSFKFHKTPRA